MAETELWFWEQRTLGKWWPRSAPTPPEKTNSEGRKRMLRGVLKVDAVHLAYPLNALRELYSRDGTLKHTQGVDHLKRVLEASNGNAA